MVTGRGTATERSTDTRSAILAAAESCFARLGIAATTMEDVARAAASSRATVYRYFTDRDALVTESVVRRARANMDSAREFIARWPTIEDRVVEGICEDIRRGRRDPMVHRLVSPEEMVLAARLLTESGRAIELTYELWEPVFATAQAAGAIRADLDIRLLCEWISQLEIQFISQGATGDADELDDIRAQLRTFLLPALLP
ncbi:TetR family transcriptional regulator [Nocardia sp. 852002-51101_SCH5132738]|nr:TetR family transcriptional regulator [Nocardia sp. 852002-51101_SCH5132738]OBB47995.1 TetR family transcriptional regulator [Nocardia sp. 852002-51244_SCH5132740]OBF66746.1 TetR family transcriptional regulator [Mycobacterium sp. 852002-51759_SCH5129042]